MNKAGISLGEDFPDQIATRCFSAVSFGTYISTYFSRLTIPRLECEPMMSDGFSNSSA